MADIQPAKPEATERVAVQTGADHLGSAQSEVQDFQRQNGNVKPSDTAASAASVHDMFGTPSFDFGDAPATAAAGKTPAASDSTAPAAAAAPADTHATRTWGQAITDTAMGVVHAGAAVGVGAYDSAANLVGQVGTAGVKIADAIGDTVAAAPHAIATAASDLAQHPIDTMGRAAGAIGHGVVATHEAIVDATKAVGMVIADHPYETAAIIGAVVAEVATVGTATPVITALGAVGAGFTAHDLIHAGENISRDSSIIAPMFYGSQSTPEQMAAASTALAKDTGSAAVDLIGMGTGIGVGRLAERALTTARTTGHGAGVAAIEETGAAVADVSPVAQFAAQFSARVAQGMQDMYDGSSALSNMHTAVGGNHGNVTAVANSRDDHRQFPAGALPPS